MKLLLLTLAFFSSLCYSQTLNFIDFKNLSQLQLGQNKTIIIRLTADWCAVCKLEMHQLKKDSKLVNDLNDRAYFINFNVETSKEPILFFGKSYDYIPNGSLGMHSLALALSKDKDRLVLPLWLVIDINNEVVLYREGRIDFEELRSYF